MIGLGVLLATLLPLMAAEAEGEAPEEATAPAAATAPAKREVAADPMARYLADLEKAGVLVDDKQPATLERLKEELAAAEDDLVSGNAEVASVRLFRIVESGRYGQFDYAPEYANAELTLARALIGAGGY